MQGESLERAWAAGLFEGEGCWGYQGTNCVVASLHMTDFDTVERFHKVVGVGTVKVKPSKNPRHKPSLGWRVSDRAGVAHVLELLRPWLGPRRIARGEEVLRLQAEYTAARAQARADFCKNGHPRTLKNTRWETRARTGEPYRQCRDCASAWQRRNRARLRAAA